MATTGELIDSLATGLRPVPRTAVAARLAIGVGGGILVSGLIMLAWMGPRPDLAAAVDTTAFWIKFAYTAVLALAGFAAAERLSRPAGEAAAAWGAAILGLLLVGLMAAAQFATASPASRLQITIGQSAGVCPWKIMALSVPVFVGTVWAMRGLAPTRLRLAGVAAGLAAGGFGAWVYSFHCDEIGMPFLAIWYTGGIAAVVVLGAIAGRWLLRW